jgi:hypothetical protein
MVSMQKLLCSVIPAPSEIPKALMIFADSAGPVLLAVGTPASLTPPRPARHARHAFRGLVTRMRMHGLVFRW